MPGQVHAQALIGILGDAPRLDAAGQIRLHALASRYRRSVRCLGPDGRTRAGGCGYKLRFPLGDSRSRARQLKIASKSQYSVLTNTNTAIAESTAIAITMIPRERGPASRLRVGRRCLGKVEWGTLGLRGEGSGRLEHPGELPRLPSHRRASRRRRWEPPPVSEKTRVNSPGWDAATGWRWFRLSTGAATGSGAWRN